MADKALCTIPGCSKPVKARGWCSNHYNRLLASGTPKLPRQAACSIPGCRSPHRSKGWCLAHYKRYLRHGDPLAGRESTTPRRETIAELERALSSPRSDQCYIWPFGHTGPGYANIRYGGRSTMVHRVICERTHGAPPSPDYEAAHNCGNSRCVSPHHLRWATSKENQADRLIHGTAVMGEQHALSKLTEDAVKEIRIIYDAGANMAQLGRMFGVNESTIGRVVKRQTWKHV